MKEFTRRVFVTKSLLFTGLAAGFNFLLAACGSSDDGSGLVVGGGDCSANGATCTVVAASGHSHSLASISAVDINAGSTTQYTLSTSSAHSHTVTVAAADFTTLQGDAGVSLTTDADGTGHSHLVTVNCI